MKNGAREVARLQRISPNTERRYRLAFETAGLLWGEPYDLPTQTGQGRCRHARAPQDRAQQISSLEPWVEKIGCLAEKGLGPRAIDDRLWWEDDAFRKAKPTISSIKRICRRFEAKGGRAEDVGSPVETEPGKMA